MKALEALAPFTAQLLEEIASEDFAGEQFTPPQEAHSIPLDDPFPDFSRCHAQLMRLALIDHELALFVKEYLGYLEEADFIAAHAIAGHIHRLTWRHVCIAKGKKP